jgi:hypothetical protein
MEGLSMSVSDFEIRFVGSQLVEEMSIRAIARH